MSEVDINSGLTMLSVHIEEARPPTNPVPTHKPRKIIFAIVLGLFLGGGLAFLFENLDDTIKTPEDLTDRLDVPLLGFVPSMDQGDADAAEAKGCFKSAYGDVFRSLRDRFPTFARQVVPTPEILDAKEPTAEERQRRGRFVLTDPTSSIAEAYRSIRASLLYSMPADTVRLLAVTSCRPREGKTTTCTNLALSVSQTGKKVLLIDGDLHRPTINKTLALTPEAGLTSVLGGYPHPLDSFQH
jgi:succinoglycan biosynthesis transport protein ExoP